MTDRVTLDLTGQDLDVEDGYTAQMILAKLLEIEMHVKNIERILSNEYE